MSDDLMRYDLLVQDALRGVVRKVLGDAARDGLPGEHHFYISFRTDAPGVKISPRLREKYPQDMTIVLQHQFWDLTVGDTLFEVGLSFSGVPERLIVPYSAVTGFFDPSVQFGLKFELAEDEAEEDAPAGGKGPRGAASEPVETAKGAKPAGRTGASGVPKLMPATPPPAADKARRATKEPAAPKEEAPAAKEAEAGASVVSLDAFRKKS